MKRELIQTQTNVSTGWHAEGSVVYFVFRKDLHLIANISFPVRPPTKCA